MGGVGIPAKLESKSWRTIPCEGDDADIKKLTLRSDDAAIFESCVKEGEVGFLEQDLGRPFGIGRIGDDDVERILLILQEFEPVADVYFDLGMLKSNGHAWKVLFRETDDGLFAFARRRHIDQWFFFFLFFSLPRPTNPLVLEKGD